MLEAKAKDQGHNAQVLSKNKKGLHKIFSGDLGKKTFSKKSFEAPQLLTTQKIVLSSSPGQGNFRGLVALRPRPRTSKCVLEDVIEDYTSGIHTGYF